MSVLGDLGRTRMLKGNYPSHLIFFQPNAVPCN